MVGVRVDQLCREFRERQAYSGGLLSRVDAVCVAAADDAAAGVFTQTEAAKLDRTSSHLFAKWGGSWAFAALMARTPRYHHEVAARSEGTLWTAVYAGIKGVAPSEPSFNVDGFTFRVVDTPNGRGLRINNLVTIRFFEDEGQLTGRVLVQGKGSARMVTGFDGVLVFAGALLPETMQQYTDADSLSTALEIALLRLPFMERVASGPVTEHPARFNAASLSRPGMTWSREVGGEVEFAGRQLPLQVDGFARFFVETGGVRYYRDSARTNAGTSVMWRLGASSFTAYSGPGAEPLTGSAAACLSGTTRVKTESGDIDLATLHRQYQEGTELPRIAAFDPTSQRIVYQRPARVGSYFVGQQNLAGGLQLITMKDDAGHNASAPLMVTTNQYLWVKRGDDERWMRASDVGWGDKLLMPAAGQKKWGTVTSNAFIANDKGLAAWKKQHSKVKAPELSFAATASRAAAGAPLVYDVAFSEGPSQFHNLVVMPTNSVSVVVHNAVR